MECLTEQQRAENVWEEFIAVLTLYLIQLMNAQHDTIQPFNTNIPSAPVALKLKIRRYSHVDVYMYTWICHTDKC